MKTLRWGILGAGKISGDFCLALRTVPKDEHQIVSVAARKQEDADRFAKHHNIPTAYSSYDSLATDADIDIVYIGVIHTNHAHLSIKMLEAGKHVLCEKPMAMSAAQAKQVLDVARDRKKLFLEGFWSRFFPVYNQLREELSKQTVGEVRALSVHFGFEFDSEVVTDIKLGGGVSLDIGCYAVQLANLVFNGERPEKIIAHGLLFPSGADKVASVSLFYKGDRVAQFFITGNVPLDNRAIVFGSRGIIEIPGFWCPTSITTPEKTYNFELPVLPESTQYTNSAGFVYEIRAVREAILNGLMELPEMKHSDSLLVAEIQDEILQQLGVKYCS